MQQEREREQSSVRQHLCTCHTCHTALPLALAGHVIYQAQLKAFGLVRCQGWTADNSGGDILNSFNHSCQLSVYECVLGIVLHHKGATRTHSTWRDNSWHADNEACLVNPLGLCECFYYLTFALSNNAYTAPRALSLLWFLLWLPALYALTGHAPLSGSVYFMCLLRLQPVLIYERAIKVKPNGQLAQAAWQAAVFINLNPSAGS